MKTTFKIVADTTAMTVKLTIQQGTKVKYGKQFDTVTDAAQFLLSGIAEVMQKRGMEAVE